MDTELTAFHAVIVKAKTCEDVFGVLAGDRSAQLSAGKTLYRKFASIVHEDRYASDDAALILAHEAFSLLAAFWRDARHKIERGVYGTKTAPTVAAVIASQKHKYQIDEAIGAGDLANVYSGFNESAEPVIVKMARHAAINDLLANEATVLAELSKGVPAESFQRLFPKIREAFRVKDHLKVTRHVNVFERGSAGVYTLNDIVANFPKGVDPRHFVWIFKRLLMVLSYAHEKQVVHGAILPTHVLVRPADHSVLLVDWSYACERGQRVLALSPGYKAYYAPEVLNKGAAGCVTDLYMAAKCMRYILGGDGSEAVPAPFLSILDACTLQNPYRRSAESLGVYDLVEKAAKAVYGAPKFVDLVLT